MQKGQKMSHINNDLMTRTIDDKHILDVSSRGPSTQLKSISFKNDLKNSEATKIYMILPRYFVYKIYQYLVRSITNPKGTYINKYLLICIPS